MRYYSLIENRESSVTKTFLDWVYNLFVVIDFYFLFIKITSVIHDIFWSKCSVVFVGAKWSRDGINVLHILWSICRLVECFECYCFGKLSNTFEVFIYSRYNSSEKRLMRMAIWYFLKTIKENLNFKHTSRNLQAPRYIDFFISKDFWFY